MKNFNRSKTKSDKALIGMILILLGLILLINSLNIFYISSWIISFPSFLILAGVIIGRRLGFKRPAAFIPIVFGSLFLLEEIFPSFDAGELFFPVLVISIGLWLILGRKKQENLSKNSPIEDREQESTESIEHELNPEASDKKSFSGDRFDSTSIFGGIKKNIVSKNFQGGEILNFFGGTEINLLQADIQGVVTINVVQVFGGTKIIVPANWTIQSEMVALIGGIEDKRPPQILASAEKILIIQGTSIFAGIDIRSY